MVCDGAIGEEKVNELLVWGQPFTRFVEGQSMVFFTSGFCADIDIKTD